MKWVVGIDEVGRGALAGPVVVVAALVPHVIRHNFHPNLGTLKDSKKLSPQKREAWAAYFKKHPRIRFVVARVYPRNIERWNISGAANIAAGRAFARLAKRYKLGKTTKIFLDGGLFLGRGPQPKQARTIIKGDEKIPAVAIASIIAKVSRDKAMVRLGKRYAAYGFDVHKGYGTRRHKDAIRQHGPLVIHRATFIGGGA